MTAPAASSLAHRRRRDFIAGFENRFRNHGTESVPLTEAVCSGASHASSWSGHLESGSSQGCPQTQLPDGNV